MIRKLSSAKLSSDDADTPGVVSIGLFAAIRNVSCVIIADIGALDVFSSDEMSMD